MWVLTTVATNSTFFIPFPLFGYNVECIIHHSTFYFNHKREKRPGSQPGLSIFHSHTELQLKSLEKILIARRARSSYETCFVISFLINHKTGSAIRRCLPD